MTPGRTAVLVILMIAVAGVIIQWINIHVEGTQGDLAEYDCATLLPTDIEINGITTIISSDSACKLMHRVAAMKPTGLTNTEISGKGWRRIGSIRIRPRDAVWFFDLYESTTPPRRRVTLVRRNRGPGWGIVGVFPSLYGRGMSTVATQDHLRNHLTDGNQQLGRGNPCHRVTNSVFLSPPLSATFRKNASI